jgi:hypothetical protein
MPCAESWTPPTNIKLPDPPKTIAETITWYEAMYGPPKPITPEDQAWIDKAFARRFALYGPGSVPAGWTPPSTLSTPPRPKPGPAPGPSIPPPGVPGQLPWNGTQADWDDAQGKWDAGKRADRFGGYTLAEFLAFKISVEWFVRGVFHKGEPFVIGGKLKTLKTSILLDLALALVSGRPFLGRYGVEKPVRVALVSGESGVPTSQATLLAACRARGIKPVEVSDRLLITEKRPVLSDAVDREGFVEWCGRHKADIALVDPWYHCGGRIPFGGLYPNGFPLDPVAMANLTLPHRSPHYEISTPVTSPGLSQCPITMFFHRFLLVFQRFLPKWWINTQRGEQERSHWAEALAC